MERSARLQIADVPLDRDVFLRSLVRELAGTLESVVGMADATGFISVVGQNIGQVIDADYKTALKVGALSREQVGDVLVDLKRRIQGDFHIIEESDEKIVLGNRACPFGDKVAGRPSLCMMTSNVFGNITSNNLGYARVVLDETIASGSSRCLVTIYLKQHSSPDEGREYFGE